MKKVRHGTSVRPLPNLDHILARSDHKSTAGLSRLAADLVALGGQEANAKAEVYMKSEHMALVVTDALAGKDISRLYPEFYGTLLKNEALMETFLETLADLSEPPTQPITPPRPFDLSFLKQLENQPAIIRTGFQHWRAIWTYSRERLEAIFNSSSFLEPVMRGDLHSLVDDHFVVLRSQIELDEAELDVVLEAFLPLDQEDQLHPLLLVRDRRGQRLPSPLEAQLRWGSYQEQGVFDLTGILELPPIDLMVILSETGEISSDLQLAITAEGS